MVHIKVQAHADRVGRDQIIHIPALVEVHLGIAGAGRERPHDHRRPAALAPDQFGDRVHLFSGKRDDGGARGQAGDLFFAGERECG